LENHICGAGLKNLRVAESIAIQSGATNLFSKEGLASVALAELSNRASWYGTNRELFTCQKREENTKDE
jgi:hypothetical protein